MNSEQFGLTEKVTPLGIALKYHTHARDTGAEQTLKVTLQDFSSRISLLTEVSDNAVELRQCRTALLSLKQAITGTHFEDEHVTPNAEGTEQVQLIAAEALRLRQCFQRFKHRQFPAR